MVNNIVINNSTYTRNFKDSISKKNTGYASYKPSLGKFFSDAANIRLRMEYVTSMDSDIKFLYKQKHIVRKIMKEKDIITGRDANANNYDSCLIKITNNGIE